MKIVKLIILSFVALLFAISCQSQENKLLFQAAKDGNITEVESLVKKC